MASSAIVTAPPSPRSSSRARRSTAADVVVGERAQLQHQRPRQQRRDHGERRVLGGRPTSSDDPVLHRREQRVLLGLGEAVHLVDEQHGLLASQRGASPAWRRSMTARTSLTPADSADSASNLRPVACEINDAERRLAGAGRPVQQHRAAPEPSTRRRSGDPGPSRCCCPRTSSRLADASGPPTGRGEPRHRTAIPAGRRRRRARRTGFRSRFDVTA